MDMILNIYIYIINYGYIYIYNITISISDYIIIYSYIIYKGGKTIKNHGY